MPFMDMPSICYVRDGSTKFMGVCVGCAVLARRVELTCYSHAPLYMFG